jgi:hypothetical protein
MATEISDFIFNNPQGNKEKAMEKAMATEISDFILIIPTETLIIHKVTRRKLWRRRFWCTGRN